MISKKSDPDRHVHMFRSSCYRFPRQCSGVACNTLLLPSSRGAVFITVSEVAIGTSLSIPVTDFLGISQVLLEVLHCSWHVAEGITKLADVYRHLLFFFCHRLPWQRSAVSCGTPLLFGILQGRDKVQRRLL